MRRVVMILFSIIIFIGATLSFAGDCGDVDGNPPVNILDIVYLINYKYKDGPGTGLWNNVRNDDGHRWLCLSNCNYW